jgi:hypothetical protein
MKTDLEKYRESYEKIFGKKIDKGERKKSSEPEPFLTKPL